MTKADRIRLRSETRGVHWVHVDTLDVPWLLDAADRLDQLRDIIREAIDTHPTLTEAWREIVRR